MHRVYSIFGLGLAGILAGMAAGVVGMSTWLATTVESRHALADAGVVHANAAQQDVPSEAWRTYAVRNWFVEVEAPPSILQSPISLPDDHALRVHFIESILPPSEAAAFRITNSEPGGAELKSSRLDELQVAVQNRRIAADPYRVLNDAQVASIKAQLKLTRNQEGMWPPVETALRKISYKKPSKGGDGNGSIDFDSPEVQQLISAAQPLIVRLSENQKREVRSLAHVMGLDTITTLF